MNPLNTNERLFVFTNVYNMLTSKSCFFLPVYLTHFYPFVVHSVISRGSPGNTLLERTSFMRGAKYNIGGLIFSLIDVSTNSLS
jgi:hypothetical protein